MVRVCKETFPKGSYKGQRGDGFAIDELLKIQLDVLLKNIINDWDFTIIITGGGEVRVGKSVLGMQIAAYWSDQIKKLYGKKVIFNLQNFVMDGRKLIKTGNYLGENYPFSSLIYDEAGADLEGRKAMQTITQDVLDYYRECGQYNLLNILILPEYFDLPKGIALSRSMFLLDVYYTATEEGLFQRGYFNFYSRRNKKYLYLKGKKNLDYNAYRYDFHGRFYNFYPVNEKEYRELKREALRKRETKRRSKFLFQRDACWYLLAHEGLECECGKIVKLTQAKLGQRMEQMTGIFVAHNTICDGISHFTLENE